MRQMSFFLTTAQFLDGTKDVTRRIVPHWDNLKPGDRLMAVNKCQGLKKGEQIKFGEIEILSNEPEPLERIVHDPVRNGHLINWDTETRREGFPDMRPREFVDFFCKANKCKPDQIVNRIVFRRV